MSKTKLMILLFTILISNSNLYSQEFNPINGTAYPFEFVTWTLNGADQLPKMQSNIRSSTITFNPNNTVVIFGGSTFTTNYTFFPNGNCEISIRTLFVRRNISGIGRIERAERNFILSLSMEVDGKEMITVLQGRML